MYKEGGLKMTRKITTEEFKKRVYDKVSNEYEVLGEYVNNKTKILMRHNSETCGNHEYLVKPKSFLDGNRCPACNDKRKGRKSKTTKQFKKELHDLVGDEYTLIGEYTGATNKVKLIHNVCGKEWEVKPNEFLSKNSRCFHCRIKDHNLKQRRTHQQFLDEVKKKYGNDYEVLSEYINSKSKVLVRHKCGLTWEIRASHLMERDMCPKCKMSIGEKLVEEYLINNNIKYETQKKFDDLIYNKPLSYDFYLPEYDILIEYQGIQHYQPVKSFGGEKAFKNQKLRDELKKSYAEDNGYLLLEVDYGKRKYKDIEDYLNEKLLV